MKHEYLIATLAIYGVLIPIMADDKPDYGVMIDALLAVVEFSDANDLLNGDCYESKVLIEVLSRTAETLFREVIANE